MPSAIEITRAGPRLLGFLIHWALFGVLSGQVCIYYLAFAEDSRRTKFFVYSVYILECFQTILVTASAFHVFGVGFGNFTFYDQMQLAWLDIPIITGLVALLSGIFYAYRISILAESYRIPSVIVLLAIIQLAGAIAQAVDGVKAGLFSRAHVTQLSITTAIWNGGSALCDIFIAIYMTYYLYRRGSEFGMPSTQRLLRRVITIVIGSGTLTASMAIANLVLTVLPGHPQYFLAASEILAKVYSNSMMVLINQRIDIRPELEAEESYDIPTWSILFRDVQTGTGRNDSQIRNVHHEARNPDRGLVV